MPERNPDDLMLLIRCPSCGQRFKVGEDLKGRTVECGSCEHRFRISDDVIVRGKKFYPGERGDTTLSHFRRVPVAIETVNTTLPAMRYAQPPSPTEFEPTPPLRILAAGIGVAIMLFIALLFILGTSSGGALDGMITEKRLLLAGFTSLLGSALILFGNPKTRAKAAVFALVMSCALIAMPFFLTAGSAPVRESDLPAAAVPVPEKTTAADPYEALRAEIDTDPLDDEIQRLKDQGSTKSAVGIFLKDLRQTNRIMVRDYIFRTLKADQSSHLYPRGKADFLMVVTGIDQTVSEVAKIVAALGSEMRTYEPISVIEIKVDNELFLEGPLEKLTNRNDPAFYDLNKRELESIDLQRVSNAVKRLAEAEPSIYRSDITRKLIDLLGMDWVDFKGDVARALSVWTETPGPAGDAALAALEKIAINRGSVPLELVALVVKEQNAGVIPIIDELWRSNPTQWESLYAEVGNPAEAAILRRFPTTAGPLRQSAVRLLGRVGAGESLTVLDQAHGLADAELKVLIENAVTSIRSRMEP